jgi:hypothetical protein
MSFVTLRLWMGALFSIIALTLACHSNAGPRSTSDDEVDAAIAKQRVIIREVMAINGTLTRATHLEFWASIHGLNDVEKNKLVSDMKKVTPLTSRYNREAWESIRLSAKLKKITKSAGFDSALNDLKVIPTFDSKKAELQSSMLFEAAAQGKSIKKDGQDIQLTTEAIASVIAGIDASLSRLACLLDQGCKAL